MTNYLWSVTGGTITAGGTNTNAITVTWNTSGAQTVSVNYTDANGCTAAAVTSYAVTVNALPVPTIAGPTPVCVNSTGNLYQTQAGMTNYVWNVSAGGTVTAGGTITDNTVTITWNTSGAQTVSVNYTNANSCTAATATVKNITVNPLPVPTIIGNSAACQNSTGNVYTTEAGMTGYTWVVTGGSVTAGGTATDRTVTVTWTALGAQTVSVNYTNGNGCTASSAIVKNVTVNALPAPTLSGPTPVCVNSTGNVYTTETGMTNYLWNVTGGTITAGGSFSNTITVTWNTAGPQTVSVNYTDANGCTAAAATTFAVTVNPLPVVTLAGPTPVCVNSTSNTYTTEASMTGYVWNISAGGSVTAGGTGTDNTVTVTWNTAGAQTVSVNYTNANGCMAATAKVFNVTVNPLPVPTITGNAAACVNSTGNIYTTQVGMTGYIWGITGGTITSGGGAGDNTAIVTWSTVGTGTISVNYTNGNGCTAATPTVNNVTVNPLPVPTLAGPASVCVNSTGNVYSTEPGMSNYIWTVPAGGTITSGGGAGNNTVTVTWNTVGPQSVSVNYNNSNGCTAAAATSYAVTVNALPAPTITGPASVCNNSTGITYNTETLQTNYLWTVSPGGVITDGGIGYDYVTVTWSSTGAKTVTVNYTNANNCTAASPTSYAVTVNALPTPSLSGIGVVCEASAGNIYSTEAGMTSYIWTVSAGGAVTAGGTATDNSVTVTWNTPGAQSVSVNYTNGNGCTATTAKVKPVTVNALPIPTITGNAAACLNSAGNFYQTQAGMTNYIWSITGGNITSGGTLTDNTVTVTWNTAGAESVSVNYTNASNCTAAAPVIKTVTVNALPVVTLAGPASVCKNSTGNIYTTEAGMSNYLWVVSAGGTITSGGTTGNNTAVITWSTTGPQSVSVNYTNANGCTAAASTAYPVTVDPLPVPTITGPAAACVTSTGNSYVTETGMTGYTWTISAGGTITGGAGTNSVTVTWSTVGAQTISVNYTNGTLCIAATPTVKNVTVNPFPVPTITGNVAACLNSTGNTYTTEGGMINYNWIISAGGTITGGGGTSSNTVVITWNTSGPQTVSVNYNDLNGCIAAAPAIKNITVNALPVPTITGTASVCINSTGNVYFTEADMTNYTWIISSGGAITAGTGTNSITVTWNSNGVHTVSVNYNDLNGCTASGASTYNVTVNPLPVPTITGNTPVCRNSTGNIYTTEPGMGSYNWSVSGGGTITGGTGTNAITVTWNTAGAQTVSVNYINTNGCTAVASTIKTITVDPLTAITVQPLSAPVCEFSLVTFNVTATGSNLTYQWYVDKNTGTFIPVADPGTYSGETTSELQIFNSVRTMNGYKYHVVVSGCPPDVTSTDAVLTVNTAPEITTHPSDVTTCFGNNVNMDADGTGTSITWEWFVNKNDGFGFVPVIADAHFSGETTKTLIILNALASYNNWIFRAKATGICGVPVNTNIARLMVTTAPTIGLQPSDKHICENGSTTFIGNGVGYVSLQWQVFSGGIWNDISDDATYSGTATNQLTVTNAPVTLNGNQYRLGLVGTCAIVNTNAAMLTVNPNPVVSFGALPVNACGNVPIVLNGNPTGGTTPYTQHRWTGDVGPLNNYLIQSPTFNSGIEATYNLNYAVVDSKGCTANGDMSVIVDSPSALFTKTPDDGCTPLTVSFTKDMTGIASFSWDFGDGSPVETAIANPVHTFTNANPSSIGYYNVKLTVFSPGGCSDTFTSIVTVYPAIDATFSSNTVIVCSGNSITYSSLPGASKYFWDFGDGVSGYFTNTTNHLYTNFTTAPVIQTVTLTTTSFYNCTDVKTLDITVMPVPLPQFTALPVSQIYNAAGNPVTFTNTTNPGTWTWLWNFGDGATSTDQSPTHTYTALGTFDIVLIVSNANCSDSVKHSVTITPIPPVANFDLIPSGCSPLNIEINNTSLNTAAPGTSYQWDFGDGGVSTAKNPSYTYFDPGTFRVQLTVTGPGGISTYSQVVNSYPSPKANFQVSPTVVFVNDEQVRMFNLTQGADSYLWDFGDGDTSKVEEPYHKYMEEGVYDVTLWAYVHNVINGETVTCSDKYVLSPAVTVETAGVIRFSTVFTPNTQAEIDMDHLPTGGTEIDQFFFPPVREKVINYKLQIFNRLGVLIFESNDINKPWNGYYQHKLCQQGVYVWYVEGKYANGQPFKKVGDVTLLH
jgi:PKD repeat protein